jgi:hypothetical protein
VKTIIGTFWLEKFAAGTWKPEMASMAPLAWALLLALLAPGRRAARTPFQARCEQAAHRQRLARDLQSRDSGYRIDNSLSYRDLTR